MNRHSFTTAFCDRCDAEHHDMECDLCPTCNAVWGCAGCGKHAGEHEVDGDRYCDVDPWGHVYGHLCERCADREPDDSDFYGGSGPSDQDRFEASRDCGRKL